MFNERQVSETNVETKALKKERHRRNNKKKWGNLKKKASGNDRDRWKTQLKVERKNAEGHWTTSEEMQNLKEVDKLRNILRISKEWKKKKKKEKES